MSNRTDRRRPDPVRLPPLTAYARRPPTRTEPRWAWQVMVKEDEGHRHVLSGRYTEREIAALLAQLLVEQNWSSQTGSVAMTTVDEMMRAWAASVADDMSLSRRTRKAYVMRAQRIAEALGDVHLSRLTEREIARARDAWIRTGLSLSTVAAYLVSLRHSWHWARSMGHVPDRDLPKVAIAQKTVLKAKPRYNRYTPTADEVATVLQLVTPRHHRIALEVAFNTGCRIGEAGRLRWRDVDLTRGTLRFDGKTGARTVAIGPALQQFLADVRDALERVDPDATVMGAPISRVDSGGSWKALHRACRDAGLRQFSPHSFRRLAVDTAVEQGLHVGHAARYFGHSEKVMIQHYMTRQPSQMHSAAALFGRGAVTTDQANDKAVVGGAPRNVVSLVRPKDKPE